MCASGTGLASCLVARVSRSGSVTNKLPSPRNLAGMLLSACQPRAERARREASLRLQTPEPMESPGPVSEGKGRHEGAKNKELERLGAGLGAGNKYSATPKRPHPRDRAREGLSAAPAPSVPASARAVKGTRPGTSRADAGAAAGPSTVTPKTPGLRKDKKSTKRKRSPGENWVKSVGKMMHRTNARVRNLPQFLHIRRILLQDNLQTLHSGASGRRGGNVLVTPHSSAFRARS